MILDVIENWRDYPFGGAWRTAFEFIEELDSSMAVGEYEIDGREIYAGVSEYSGRPLSECRFEAHRRYADIQALLAGGEYCGWRSLKSFSDECGFDASRDVGFFDDPVVLDDCFVLAPGRFAYFAPDDAHAPQIVHPEYSGLIRKVVVKIAFEKLS